MNSRVFECADPKHMKLIGDSGIHNVPLMSLDLDAQRTEDLDELKRRIAAGKHAGR